MLAAAALCLAGTGANFAQPSPAWQDGPGYRYLAHAHAGGTNAGFNLLASAATGVQFTNHLSRRLVAMNRVTENGSGVALGDVDGDGWCDIYFCRLEGDNVLYRNLGGWKFEDITARAGLACGEQLSTGAVFADLDGDGGLDLLVNSIGGGTRAFFNDGRAKFTESTEGRLVRRFGSTSMALSDFDRDGDLDLYVANYRTITFKDEFPRPKVEARMRGGKIVVTPPGRFVALGVKQGSADIFELAERDFLFLNNGTGQFAPVSWTNGNFLDARGESLASAPLDWGLSAMMRDINGDQLADILVCNDFFNSPDQIWLQQPGLRFQLAAPGAIRKFSLASMAVDVADINRDGHDDLFFAEMLSRDLAFRQSHRDNLLKGLYNLQNKDPQFQPEAPRNTLFLGRGDGTYAEIAELSELDASEWSWGAVFLDVDLDGWEDLLIPAGHNHDVQDADVLRRQSQNPAPDSIEQRMANLSQFPRLDTPIFAFRNDGRLGFTERQREWGLDIPGVANGFAAADLDNDGDLDLAANRLNSAALLFENRAEAARVAIRVRHPAPNTRGIGTRITVRGAPEQQQEIIAGGRYLSGDDTLRVFACAGRARVTVDAVWPDGTQTTFADLPVNRTYELAKPAQASPRPAKRAPEPFFADASAKLNHRHADPEFNDFTRQPFLPHSLVSQGPALAWFDADGDGFEDLLMGAGRGGAAAFLRNTGAGFAPWTNGPAIPRPLEDQMGLLAARFENGAASLLIAEANYEAGGSREPSVRIAPLDVEGAAGSLPGHAETAGALALADVDGDGDLDLFAAGRVIPGRYPSAASSRIYLRQNGLFTLSAEKSRPFENIGLATSVVFTDLDNSGSPDLLLALEGGPIRAFLNERGVFTHADLGLEKWRGLWTGIATGDFDGDGRTDFAAGNWGRNTRYERFVKSRPLRVYHGDLDGNGTYDILEAVYNPSLHKYVPLAGPELIIDHLPAAAERFPTYAAYGQAGIEEVLGRPAGEVQMLEINTLDSMCFLNRGAHFEAVPLPVEAQFAPVFGLAAADLDQDGREDLALGQNLFEARWEQGRLDSGQPLWLRGDGAGHFAAVAPLESGLSADGQQRAVALADFNRDGRLDLAMSQHNGPALLFENRRAPAGLRLRFAGSAENQDAIGARYRIDSPRGSSPVRELQAGGGWLSQQGLVQVVAKPPEGSRLAVVWPGGAKSEFALPPDAAEILVQPAGVKVLR